VKFCLVAGNIAQPIFKSGVIIAQTDSNIPTRLKANARIASMVHHLLKWEHINFNPFPMVTNKSLSEINNEQILNAMCYNTSRRQVQPQLQKRPEAKETGQLLSWNWFVSEAMGAAELGRAL
jgi:hypothetical protein